jgi:multidrug efflux pump subunit AcrB
MNGAIAWFVENPVAANFAMLVIVVSGLVAIPNLTEELIPKIELEAVSVSTIYPGASPEEVEASITNRVEEALEGLQGIKQIRSTSAEGVSGVTVELIAGEDVRRRLDEIRAAVDAIDTFPDETEDSTITQIEISTGVLKVAVSGQTDEWTLKRLGQMVRDEIVALPGISEVSLTLDRPYEVTIEVSEVALRSFGLTFDDVVQAVRLSSLDLPAGSVKTNAGEILLRAKGQAYEQAEFENIALVSRRDGTRLRVGDVATVVDGFEESDLSSRFDGLPTLMVDVDRVGNQKAIEISRTVNDYVDEASLRMPEGIEIRVWGDTSQVLSDRLSTMTRNARGGFIMVVIILSLFLRLRLALWVSMGVPISFLGAVGVMPALDMSINFVSLMAFIVVLGIVVDDAIVVGENTHTLQQKTGDKKRGAILGAQTIVVPVTFGVLTTIAAFSALAFLPGATGRMTRVVPIIVICCLLFSLFESLFILPSHLASGKKALDAPPTTPISRRWRRFQAAIERGLQSLIHDKYIPALKVALEWRYLTVAIATGILIVTMGLVSGGFLKFVFQDHVEDDFIVADVTMAKGTPAFITAKAVDRIENAAREIQAEIDVESEPGSPSVIEHLMAAVGQQPFGPGASFGRRGSSAGNLGEVQMAVVGFKNREIGIKELTQRWREKVGDIPGAEDLQYRSDLFGQGPPLEVRVVGTDLDELRKAADAVGAALDNFPGVYGVADSFSVGKKELEYQIRPSAEALGLTLADLARQLRQGFYGAEAQTIQRGRDEVKVMVRYPASQRRSLSDVEDMRIRSRDGIEVPFSSVAKAELSTGYSAISHVNRMRVITVTAEIDDDAVNANEVVAALNAGPLDAAVAPYHGVSYSFEGMQADQREFVRAQLISFALALGVIYALLAVPLGSYTQPLIIMTAIPFGFVGAAWGHILLGFKLTMYSMIGFVALAGVVVNSSLVLVDAVNRSYSAGTGIADAVVEAAASRLRPILLTSLTTFAGLTPMMLETSLQARFMIPMAISIAFGVVFSSFITLFMVPCSYLVLDDIGNAMSRRSEVRAGEDPRASVSHLEESAKASV